MDDKKGEGCVDYVKEIYYDLYWISKWLLTTTLDNKQNNSCGIIIRVFLFVFCCNARQGGGGGNFRSLRTRGSLFRDTYFR